MEGSGSNSAEPLVKLSSSLEILPPKMSEMSVVLLGNSSTEQQEVTDFIMGACTTFDEIREGDFVRVRGQIKDKEIFLLETPELPPNLSADRLTELIENCERLSAPGPHVFLLVLQPEDFTEGQKKRLCTVLRLFSDESFNHSLTLISTPREEKPGFKEEFRQQPVLKDLIKVCKYRYMWRKDLELPELLTRLGQVVKETGGERLEVKKSGGKHMDVKKSGGPLHQAN